MDTYEKVKTLCILNAQSLVLDFFFFILVVVVVFFSVPPNQIDFYAIEKVLECSVAKGSIFHL